MSELKVKEKYVLLDDDSDGENEEYNKMKLSSMNAQHGKRYSPSRFRCFAWYQPQWICHSFFILLLLLSQVGSVLYVLHLHGEIAKIKVGQMTGQQNEQLAQQSVKMAYIEENLGERNAELRSKVEDLYEKLEEIKFSLARSRKLQNEPHVESDMNHPHNVAMIDKKMNILEDDINHIKEELGSLQAKREILKDNVKRMDNMTDNQEFSYLYEFIHEVNESSVSSSTELKGKIHGLHTLTSDLNYKLSAMETSLLSLRELINTQGNELYQFEDSLRKISNGSDDLKNLQIQLDQRLDNVYQQISRLREEFYQNDNVLNPTHQTDSDGQQFQFETTTYSPPQSEGTSPISYKRKHQQVPDVQIRQVTTESFTKKASTTNVVVISSIKSLRALQSFFYQADWAALGYLSYEDLMNNLGERTPQEEEMKPFDENNDGRFSYLEMKRALGLQE